MNKVLVFVFGTAWVLCVAALEGPWWVAVMPVILAMAFLPSSVKPDVISADIRNLHLTVDEAKRALSELNETADNIARDISLIQDAASEWQRDHRKPSRTRQYEE